MTKLATVNVPADVLLAFKQAVFAKHGRLYGCLMSEAAEALRTHTLALRPPPKE